MTPAVNTLKKAKVAFTLHHYEHSPASKSFGEEAALKLNVSQAQIFKTLMVSLDNNELAVSIVPVSGQLNLKACAKSMGSKKAQMADPKKAERSTGYVLGGISPLGQKKQLKTVIDSSALDFETIYISAGKRGLQIELSANDLAKLTKAVFAPISA
ncbi:MAG: Cys-tRNA(Pro) deacylase [Syntrophaceae bacterium]|nr:Cys-tRNA(Pro) deacylase [Syntrophaceae bacterium]